MNTLKALTTKLTATGLAVKGPCNLCGMLVGGTDGVNDPTVTIYNNTEASGVEVMPTCDFDAATDGLNGFMPGFMIHCNLGIYVEITCLGTVEVVIYYNYL